MDEKLNLFQKINKIREAIGYVQKDKSVSTGGGSYKAVTHDAVTGMLRKHLVEQGVIIIPNLVEAHTDEKREGEKQYRYRATYSFDFINADQPDERISIKIEAHAMDNADKAPGKAISYAKKYAVLKLFEIETGEDEESRYQREEIDVVPLVEAMEACKTLSELQAAYAAAYNAAIGDKDATKTIIAAKNFNKTRIENASRKTAVEDMSEQYHAFAARIAEAGPDELKAIAAELKKSGVPDEEKAVLRSLYSQKVSS